MNQEGLKVLMLGWEDPEHIHGGLGVAGAALAQALGQLIELDYWFPSPGGTAPAGRSYRSLPLPVDLPAYAGRPGADWYGAALDQALQRYGQLVREYGTALQPDLIHAHDWMTFPAAAHLAQSHQVPLVYHVHSLASDREGPDPSSPAWETERTWLPEADLVLTVSDYSAEQLVEQYQIDPDRVQVLRHGAPAQAPFRSPKPFPEKLVVFAGRMTWQKGPQHFLNLAHALLAQRDDVRFVMAGEGEAWPGLLREIGRYRSGLRIQGPGKLSQQELFYLYSMADLLVMTSESEPFGLVALEAAHFSVPCILPPHCGAAEILTHCPQVPPQDLETLSGQVQRLLDHPKKAKRLVNQQLRAIQNLQWEDTANALLARYQRLA